MGRPPGSRNADYESKRQALARSVVPLLLDPAATRPSLRELARAAGVSVSTMRHYFGDRSGIVEAAFSEVGATAREILAESTRRTYGPAELRLRRFLLGLVDMWDRHEVGRAHAAGLVEGLHEPQLGPVFAREVSGVLVHSTELLLQRLELAGHLEVDDAHTAAWSLLSPVVHLLLHRDSLSDGELAPDVERFVERHARGFVNGHVVGTVLRT